jgi:tRNA threonylcarbamoyladenosine biosynthesis protein TsaE
MELETLGLRDYLNRQTLLLIEWPERGAQVLPRADLLIALTTQPARNASCHAETDTGHAWLRALTEDKGD